MDDTAALRALLEVNPAAKRAYDAERAGYEGQLNLMQTRVAFQDAVIVQKDADFARFRRSMDNVLSRLRRSEAEIAALRWVCAMQGQKPLPLPCSVQASRTVLRLQ